MKIGGCASLIHRIERQDPHLDAADWEEVGTTTDMNTTIVRQERGKRLDFRVMGFNRAGTGTASNTVAATL